MTNYMTIWQTTGKKSSLGAFPILAAIGTAQSLLSTFTDGGVASESAKAQRGQYDEAIRIITKEIAQLRKVLADIKAALAAQGLSGNGGLGDIWDSIFGRTGEYENQVNERKIQYEALSRIKTKLIEEIQTLIKKYSSNATNTTIKKLLIGGLLTAGAVGLIYVAVTQLRKSK